MAVTTTRADTRHQVGRFARHFIEMCLVMCVGGAALNALIFLAGPALVGYADLRTQSPQLALFIIGFDYALVMAVWMRLRGMDWRPTLEMSGATIGLAVVIIGLAAAGVVSDNSLRGWTFGFCGPACLVMLVVMLFRLDLYSGRTGHQMAHRSRTEHQASTG